MGLEPVPLRVGLRSSGPRTYKDDPCSAEWLAAAKAAAGFMLRSGWDDQAGGWVLLLSRDGGDVLRGYESIYCDAFAIYGLTQLWLALKQQQQQHCGDGEQERTR